MTSVLSSAGTRPVYQVIADGLAANDVGATFGLMGEDTADLITDLDRVEIPYYAARHENVAVNMADGYAAMTGLGVAILSRGPGITNAATALVTASRRRSPILVISGEMPAGSGAFAGAMKRVDHATLATVLGVEYRTVRDGEALADAFEEAVALARSGQITQLAVPVDILRAVTSTVLGAAAADGARDAASPPGLSDADVAEVVALLGASRRPFILAGRGATAPGVREQLEAIAARTGALVGTTMQAKDLFRDSPYDVGVVGGFSSDLTRELLEQIDGALVFGARLSDFTSAHGRIFKELPVLQFDLDPKLPASGVQVRRQFVADAGTAAGQIVAALPQAGADTPPQHDTATLEQVVRTHVYEGEDLSRADVIDPRVLTTALDGILPRDRTILTDGGHCMGFPAMHMRVPGAGSYLLYDGIGSIGVGIGTGMGASIGRPGPTFALFAGDGSMSMTMGDLETVARYGLPLVIVIYNDGSYGAERHFLDLDGHSNHKSIFGDIDFAAVARGLGIEAATVRTLDDLEAMRPALSQKRTTPVLLDCKIVPELRSRWMEEF